MLLYFAMLLNWIFMCVIFHVKSVVCGRNAMESLKESEAF